MSLLGEDTTGRNENGETTQIESTTGTTANADAPPTRSHDGTESESARENTREMGTDTQQPPPPETEIPTP
jgi:hypothetical protein